MRLKHFSSVTLIPKSNCWLSAMNADGVSILILFPTLTPLLLLFSHSVMSNSVPPQGLQQARLPCSSPTPGTYSNSCPLSWWCHPTISSSAIPLSSCLQSFPASGSFLKSQSFISGGQSLELLNQTFQCIQDWFPLGLTALISFAVQETLKSLL